MTQTQFFEDLAVIFGRNRKLQWLADAFWRHALWLPGTAAVLLLVIRPPAVLLVGLVEAQFIVLIAAGMAVLWVEKPTRPLRETHLLAARVYSAYRFLLFGLTLFVGSAVGALASTSLGDAVAVKDQLALRELARDYLTTPAKLLLLFTYVVFAATVSLDIYRIKLRPATRSAHDSTSKTPLKATRASVWPNIIRCVICMVQIAEDGVVTVDQALTLCKSCATTVAAYKRETGHESSPEPNPLWTKFWAHPLGQSVRRVHPFAVFVSFVGLLSVISAPGLLQ